MTKEHFFIAPVDDEINPLLRQGAYRVRNEAFVVERDVDPNHERDDQDDTALHVVSVRATETNYNWDKQVPILNQVQLEDVVAAARIVPSQHTGLYKVERVAVLREYRGHKLGSKIMVGIEEEAKKVLDVGAFYLAGMTEVEYFYLKLGYFTIPNSHHVRQNIDHIKMIKPLNDHWKQPDHWNEL